MAKVFQVSYDLKSNGKRDYNGLYYQLRQSPKWKHVLESTWLIWTNETVEELWERFRPHIDDDDIILILEAGKDYHGFLPEDAWQWIEKNIISLN